MMAKKTMFVLAVVVAVAVAPTALAGTAPRARPRRTPSFREVAKGVHEQVTRHFPVLADDDFDPNMLKAMCPSIAPGCVDSCEDMFGVLARSDCQTLVTQFKGGLNMTTMTHADWEGLCGNTCFTDYLNYALDFIVCMNATQNSGGSSSSGSECTCNCGPTSSIQPYKFNFDGNCSTGCTSAVCGSAYPNNCLFQNGYIVYTSCVSYSTSSSNIDIDDAKKMLQWMCSRNPSSNMYCPEIFARWPTYFNATTPPTSIDSRVCGAMQEAGCCLTEVIEIIKKQADTSTASTILDNILSTCGMTGANEPMPCVKPGDPVKVVVASWKIDGLDFNAYSSATDSDKALLRGKVACDIASNINVNCGQVIVTKISQGSWIVDFETRADSDAATLQLAQVVETKGKDPALTFPTIAATPGVTTSGSTVGIDPSASKVTVETQGTLPPPSGSKSKAGLIAGITVACVIIVAALVGVAVWSHRKNRTYAGNAGQASFGEGGGVSPYAQMDETEGEMAPTTSSSAPYLPPQPISAAQPAHPVQPVQPVQPWRPVQPVQPVQPIQALPPTYNQY